MSLYQTFCNNKYQITFRRIECPPLDITYIAMNHSLLALQLMLKEFKCKYATKVFLFFIMLPQLLIKF